ncbi:MAG: hypothetical protein BWY45_03055 [Euryarchaeota archaeon ADurb.Bin294]|nr:MAG: hypothetical protein BWY45_03055 [Euryarchaeota archaeon ADurb.Bin294]
MSGEKKSIPDVQQTFIPIYSKDMGLLIPPNSRELEMRQDGTDTLMEGVF